MDVITKLSPMFFIVTNILRLKIIPRVEQQQKADNKIQQGNTKHMFGAVLYLLKIP